MAAILSQLQPIDAAMFCQLRFWLLAAAAGVVVGMIGALVDR
jgi:hypothetical protein